MVILYRNTLNRIHTGTNLEVKYGAAMNVGCLHVQNIIQKKKGGGGGGGGRKEIFELLNSFSHLLQLVLGIE